MCNNHEYQNTKIEELLQELKRTIAQYPHSNPPGLIITSEEFVDCSSIFEREREVVAQIVQELDSSFD